MQKTRRSRNTGLTITVLLGLTISSLQSCRAAREIASDDEDSPSSNSNLGLESGDVVISQTGNRSIIVLDSDGNFKGTLFDGAIAADSPWGLAWNSSTEQVIAAIDGVDRILAFNRDFSEENYVVNANLTGTLKDLVVTAAGDLFVIETNLLEKFDSSGNRYTTGGFPTAANAPQNTLNGLSPRAAGGFIACSSGSDVVRNYDSSAVGINTARASGITGTTDAMDCIELADGSIAVAWSGTTDTVQIINSDLSAVLDSFSDLNVLSTPGGIAEANNGNLLVIDTALHRVVEIDTQTGDFHIFASSVLNAPKEILVIP